METEKMYELECEVCGTFFESPRSNTKYCPKCRRNSSKAQRIINKNVAMNKYKMGYAYDAVEYHCSYCDKFVKMGPRKLRNRCWFCNDGCKEKYEAEVKERLKESRASMPVKVKPMVKNVCKYCGKEFEDNKKRVYCSRDCQTKGQTKYERVSGDITCTCKGCGKKFMIHSDKPISVPSLPKVCSEECRKKVNAEGTRLAAERKQYWADLQTKLDDEKKQKEYEQNGLCGYCKTPYKKCERMQSNFRIIPKGAKFNMNGKIISCPKFCK